MKCKFIALLLVSTSLAYGQSVEVKSKQKLPLAEAAYYPVFDEQGSKVLFTSEDYKGLKVYDMPTNTKSTISTDVGAGYTPVFTGNGSDVYHRKSSYVGGRKYDALVKTNLTKMKQEEVVAPSRELKSPIAVKQGVVVASGKKLLKTSAETAPYVSIEDGKIALYKGSARTELQPNGINTSYIWPSVSPDGSKILFTCTGKGTFVADLNGKILYSLGAINAPVWYTNDYVVGMIDRDNGSQFIASKIIISSTDGKFKQDLTASEEIGMYPSTSPSTNSIVYNTSKGDVYVLTVNVKK